MGEGRTQGSTKGRRLLELARDCIPRGGLLDDATFRRRHLLLSLLLAAHLPALFVFAWARGFDPDEALLGLLPAIPFLVVGRVVRQRRIAALFITAGLAYCAAALVYFSGGSIEAHFHFFVLIGFIALYQDWVPFAWNVVFVVLSHGMGSAFRPDALYDHPAAQNDPWGWALIHGGAVLAACLGVAIYWRSAELEQRRSLAMAGDLAAAKLATAEAETSRRRSESELLVHLARRNQSLLDRQLALISGLENTGEVFKLDHLATRMRRNAESLLVLAGEEPPRRRGESVLLAAIVRAAVAEAEDYSRIEMMVHDYVEVHSAAVEDLVHLLAELVENATMYSSPTTKVRLRTLLPPGEDSETVVVIEDNGIGMPEVERARANKVLTEPPELDGAWSTLGFQVVGRLARRHGLRVWVEETTGGGLTALVSLPAALVGRRHLAASSTGAVADGEVQVVDGQGQVDDVQWRAVDVGTAARLRLPSLPPSVVADTTRGRAPASVSTGEEVDDVVVHHDWGDDEAGLEQAAPLFDHTAGREPEGEDPGLPEEDPPTSDGEAPRDEGHQDGDERRSPPSAGDRVAASAMLSQFQASQRAGRIMTGRPQHRREEDEGDLGDQ